MKRLPAVWPAREREGHFWNPSLGTFKPPEELVFVPCGDAVLTRKVKEIASHVVLEKQGRYGHKVVGYLANAAKVEELRAELAARPSVRERRFEKFARKYESWKEALLDACEALFSLNRYAKHLRCSPEHRATIYELKNAMIQLLYREGYAVACWEHTKRLEEEERVCRVCDGDGFVERRGYPRECPKCKGEGGWAMPERELAYICFRFIVAGRPFVWHQPWEEVDFDVTYTSPPENWEQELRVKPLGMSPTKFAEAKDLLRWVLKERDKETSANIC